MIRVILPPHLRTLDVLSEVTGIALYDPDPIAAERVRATCPKAERVHGSIDELLARRDV